MSYIRGGYPYNYVEGISEDYIFLSSIDNSNDVFIEDYGKISNETIVELVAKNLYTDSPKFRVYLIQKLADKLNVKLKKEAFENES